MLRTHGTPKWPLIVTAVAVLAFFLIEHKENAPEPLRQQATAKVVKVIDGDTIRVELENRQETVRYIGVDTPETVKPNTPLQCFGKEASSFNKHLVGEHQVRLVPGHEQRDRYGRLLAYVYVGSNPAVLVNAELLKRGYARTLTISPNTRFARRFAALSQSARRLQRGLWAVCIST